MRGRNRLLILDTLGDYGAIFPATLNVSIDGIEKFGNNPAFRLRYLPKTEDDLTAALNKVWNIGNMLISLDEVGVWMSSAYIPPALSSLLRYGRHRRLDMIFVARRPTELNRMVTAQADTFYVFHTHESRDLTYLDATISQDVSEAAQKLRVYEYVKFSYPSELSRGKTIPLPSTPGKSVSRANSWLE